MFKFAWDERKNQANYRKHGFSFTNAWEIFTRPMLIEVDERLDYGKNAGLALVFCVHGL